MEAWTESPAHGSAAKISQTRRRFACYPVRIMRAFCFLGFILTAILPGSCQTAASAAPGLPKDPREILTMAAPYYDFADPALKPFHIKATYQLYDEHGKPSEQGTYEYWWASPTVNRSTWTRPGVSHTVWHTADGKQAVQAIGEPLKFFEYKLQAALLSPLPDLGDLDPAKVRLEPKTASLEPVINFMRGA